MDATATVATTVREGWVVWEVPGKPIMVRLSFDVVSRIGLAVWEGFKSLPRRGLETGGLLIGNRQDCGSQVLVEIADFEAVESEHAAGPSYLLSEPDRRLLESRIAAHGTSGRKLHVVGFYRSHTRTGFGMTLEDEYLFSNYFRKPSDVFLLIRSNGNASPIGGFLIREGGRILSATPYSQFTFSSEQALQATPEVSPALPPQCLVPTDPTKTVVVAAPPAAGRPASRHLIIAAAGAAILGAILATDVSRAIWRRPPVAAPSSTAAPLALSVSDFSGGLRLSWDHRASQRASRAILWIRDGELEHKVELDPKQLNEGSIAYWPRTNDVDFRLQLVVPNGPVTESVRSIGGPVRPTEPPAPVEAVVLPLPRVLPTPAVRRVRQAAVPSRHHFRPFELIESPAQRASISEPPATDQIVGVALPDGISFPGAMAPIREPLSINGPNPPSRVRVEPVQRLSRVFPLIGKRKQQSNYVPPTPLHEPAIPALPAHNVEHPISIDVKVYVDQFGKVDYSEVLSKVTPANFDLATSAVFSARKCQFTPAYAGSETVRGEVILHYQYGPVTTAPGSR
jgi:hypothetical protein